LRRILIGLLVVVIVYVAWLAVTGVLAANKLSAAQSQIVQARSAMSAGNTAQTRQVIAQITKNTSSANDLVNSLPWKLTQHLPFVGPTATAVGRTTESVDIAASGAISPLADVVGKLSMGTLRDEQGRVDLKAVSEIEKPAVQAQALLQKSLAVADSAPTSGVFGPIETRVTQARNSLQEMLRTVSASATAAQVMPILLGGDGTQRFFVGFTSPAEARGTGGFLGTYGILKAKDGAVSLEKVGANSELKDFTKPVVELGPDYNAIYGLSSGLWSGMNISPHFPFAAKQWIEGWRRQTGEQLQGAISVDPAALSYIISQQGPVTLPNGAVLQENEVVPYLTNGIYFQFERDNNARKAFQVAIAKSATSSLTQTGTSPTKLIAALAKGASERRILVYSVDKEVEKALAPWPISGTIDNRAGPYAMLVVNNAAGNKADAYLDRSLTYQSVGCSKTQQKSRVDATLTNQIPATGSLPSVIDVRNDTFGRLNGHPRATRVTAEVLLPMNSVVTSVTVNGVAQEYPTVIEAGRSGVFLTIELPRGQAQTMSVEFLEPISTLHPRVIEQPLARPQTTIINWKPCT